MQRTEHTIWGKRLITWNSICSGFTHSQVLSTHCVPDSPPPPPPGAWDIFNACPLELTFPPEQNEARPDREADCCAGKWQEGDRHQETPEDWMVWVGGEAGSDSQQRERLKVDNKARGNALSIASEEIPRIRD